MHSQRALALGVQQHKKYLSTDLRLRPLLSIVPSVMSTVLTPFFAQEEENLNMFQLLTYNVIKSLKRPTLFFTLCTISSIPSGLIRARTLLPPFAGVYALRCFV